VHIHIYLLPNPVVATSSARAEKDVFHRPWKVRFVLSFFLSSAWLFRSIT
jgi:hypothetical protein